MLLRSLEHGTFGFSGIKQRRADRGLREGVVLDSSCSAQRNAFEIGEVQEAWYRSGMGDALAQQHASYDAP